MTQENVITPEMLQRMKELEQMMKGYRETLSPKLEKISETLSKMDIWTDILEIMTFEGKDKFKTEAKIEVGEGEAKEKREYEIVIKRKQ